MRVIGDYWPTRVLYQCDGSADTGSDMVKHPEIDVVDPFLKFSCCALLKLLQENFLCRVYFHCLLPHFFFTTHLIREWVALLT